MTGSVSARRALTPEGWVADVAIFWDAEGRITGIGPEGFVEQGAAAIILPGLSNVHTHSFQRAMAGLAERRGPDGADDFWTWRKIMYRFLEILTPDDIEAIAAQVQREMAEAGYSASAEFHYVHHQPGGAVYDDPAETSLRILSAGVQSGIGLTHLPVLYSHGGFDRRELTGGQLRFGSSIDQFANLYARIAGAVGSMPSDFRLGVAPHSLRAVDEAGLRACVALAEGGPIHIHAAEQVKEVEEAEIHLGARPVRWLLDHLGVDARWCLIHATHLDEGEVADLAASGAVAGLCPTTEANLGDGVFAAESYLAQDGRFGIGSDSNIRLSVTEELRMLELSQRLAHRRRVLLADGEGSSNGRYLYERAAAGGAQAIGRPAGVLAVGALADLVALGDTDPLMQWPDPDLAVDAWIFGSEGRQVRDVWSAGRHIVQGGRHIRAEAIGRAFADTMERLRRAL